VGVCVVGPCAVAFVFYDGETHVWLWEVCLAAVFWWSCFLSLFSLCDFNPFWIASLVRPAISHPASQLAGRPAGWPKTKHQLAGRPAGHNPSTSWPAGRTPQTKNQLATVAPAEAKRQPASQPASQPAGGPKTKPGE